MIIGYTYNIKPHIMKTFLYLLVFVTLSSCSLAQYPISVHNTYDSGWVGYYNFNAIHRLYVNNPTFVYTHYYNHPHFVRYRQESTRRGIFLEPRYYTTPRKPSTPKVTTSYRQNSGRSNQTNTRSYSYRKPSYQKPAPQRIVLPNSVRSSTRSNSGRINNE